MNNAVPDLVCLHVEMSPMRLRHTHLSCPHLIRHSHFSCFLFRWITSFSPRLQLRSSAPYYLSPLREINRECSISDHTFPPNKPIAIVPMTVSTTASATGIRPRRPNR